MRTKVIVVMTAVSMMLTAGMGRPYQRVSLRDKSGTMRGRLCKDESQTVIMQRFVTAGSFQAERAGFSLGRIATSHKHGSCGTNSQRCLELWLFTSKRE
jgi:hypothetical protein